MNNNKSKIMRWKAHYWKPQTINEAKWKFIDSWKIIKKIKNKNLDEQFAALWMRKTHSIQAVSDDGFVFKLIYDAKTVFIIDWAHVMANNYSI
jgi:hypothetical protein